MTNETLNLKFANQTVVLAALCNPTHDFRMVCTYLGGTPRVHLEVDGRGTTSIRLHSSHEDFVEEFMAIVEKRLTTIRRADVLEEEGLL